MRRAHHMPFGAEVDGGAVRFRLWAPAANRVELALEGEGPVRLSPMTAAGGGWFALVCAEAGPGARYRFRVDGGALVPDPASRFQPEDVHGPSEVIDPGAYEWRDEGWRGRPWEEAVFYELHVGAFTPEGNFRAVADHLDHLVALGVTAVELMPVGDWPGARNWGYDGAYPFAPDGAYGRPEALKALIEAAHERELMVFLDVVYNHFGPEGNYLGLYAPQFFTDRRKTPWGAAIDFEAPHARTVRDFFIENALYWLVEYGLDGLRLDAVHAIFDRSRPDILEEIAASVRARIGAGRRVHLVLENDNNEAHYLARRAGRTASAFTAQWNDDCHHALHVLLTGERDSYYADYAQEPARHLGRSLAEGFAYQGEASQHRGGRPRGEPSRDLPPTSFVNFLQNHDQIGNRAFGERIDALADEAAIEAALSVLLLAPSPPLLFMGEEWGARAPFPFFCDFEPGLADRVREGRRREFARASAFRDEDARARIPDPTAATTLRRAVLDWAALGDPGHARRLAYCRELLALRRREIVPRLAGIAGGAGHFAVLGPTAIEVRWRLGDGAGLTLRTNLGAASLRTSAARPQGHVLHAQGVPPGADRDVLPPWSAEWVLDPAPS